MFQGEIRAELDRLRDNDASGASPDDELDQLLDDHQPGRGHRPARRCAHAPAAALNPRPFRFFTWIISLLTLVAVLALFMTDAKLATNVATAAIGLVIAMAMSSLVSGAARSAIRLGRQDPRLPER